MIFNSTVSFPRFVCGACFFFFFFFFFGLHLRDAWVSVFPFFLYELQNILDDKKCKKKKKISVQNTLWND